MNTNRNLSVWNGGFGGLSDFRTEVEKLFDDFLTPSTRGWNADWNPAVDVEETADHYLLTVDVPGVTKDQLKLEVIGSQVILSGERKEERKDKSAAWHSERRYGKFRRSFTLPNGVDSSKVEAQYEDGMLRVYLPKAESAKPRQIKIASEKGSGFFGKQIGSDDRSKEKAAS
ncbi:MAG TPA: Hsp20/alpha crystallin family protein [Bdellovibrionota bacterium]|jgi:HSP20 family protein|nr:Hsp20/alpha crystallin family protein [Bdellovibrionota bacterium]